MENNPDHEVKFAQVKSVLTKQVESHKAERILHNLRDVLVIEAQTDPLIQKELVGILIRTLKALELSEEQAITNIRAITTNVEILSILDASPDTEIITN